MRAWVLQVEGGGPFGYLPIAIEVLPISNSKLALFLDNFDNRFYRSHVGRCELEHGCCRWKEAVIGHTFGNLSIAINLFCST